MSSSTPWNNNNSFGISYSGIFRGMEDIEFANISCSRSLEKTDDSIVSRSFHITTKMLINNLLSLKNKVGIADFSEKDPKKLDMESSKAVTFAKKRRWMILFWAQDILWKLGHWKNAELNRFIDDFSPNLIFQPVYYVGYMNDIAQYIKKRTGVPMIGYISDDNYTLKQFSLSPLFWIDRLIKRKKVKKTIEMCDLLYVISDIQKQEYEKIFKVPCKVLTRGEDFTDEPKLKKQYGDPLQLVFTGNMGANRWRSLGLIAEALKAINTDGVHAQLRIYTPTPITSKMEKALNIENSSFIMGKVPATEVEEIQRNADILVHAEGLDLKNRLLVRQSFSTKLVDYFKMARPILAVGPKDIASIAHLKKNDCAIVAETVAEIKDKLVAVLNQRERLDEKSINAYNCGRCHHEIFTIQGMVRADIETAIKDKGA